MRLPHYFIHAPWERRITHHAGVTYLFWTFVDLDRPPSETFRRHEQRHVQQSVAITLVVAVALLLATHFGALSDWWTALSLFGWPVAYWIASVIAKVRTGKGYTDNYFERDARRYADAKA